MKLVFEVLSLWSRSVLGLIVVMLSGISASQAADWSLVPSATYRFMYDDNYLTSINQPLKVLGNILDLDAKFKFESEKNVVDFMPKVSIRRIEATQEDSASGDQEPDYDREDYYLKLHTTHTMKWMDIQFNANAASDSTELDPEQFNQFQSQSLATRKRWDAAPTFIFQLTELTNMNIGVNYSDVRYDDVENLSSLNDYTNGSAFLGFTKEIAERMAFTLSFNGSLLQSDSNLFNVLNTHNETTTYSMQGNINYEFSESETIRFMLGGRYTQFVNEILETNTKTEDSDDGYVLDFDYSKNFENNEWHAIASRSVVPNGSGRLSQRDKIALTMSHQLLSDLRLNFGLNVTRIDDYLGIPDSDRNENDAYRVYSSGNIGTTWLFARDWRFGVAYLYRSNYYTGPEVRAKSNSANLSITYVPRSARPYEIY